MNDLENMSTKELEHMLQQAKSIAKVGIHTYSVMAREIAQRLGTPFGPDYRKKYQYDDEIVRIFFDEAGNYVSVCYSGVTVLSDHPVSEIYRAGYWMRHLEGLRETLKSKDSQKKKELLEKLRNYLPLEEGY